MSAYLIERIEAHPLIDVHVETQLTELHTGGGQLSAVTFADSAGKSETRAVDGVFLCIGGRPHTEWCSREHVLTDARGYILTGQDMTKDGRLPDCWPLERDPFPLETSRVGRKRIDRKSTRLNSSHVATSYAVFCLKKKKTKPPPELSRASWRTPTDGRSPPPPRPS